ncbi:MAG: GFA family protein [Micropepsaceae bacterium]
MKISGQCLCGSVRYHGDAEPRFQVKCYCIDCRKVSAAGHAAMMGFPSAEIALRGATKEYQSKADSGSDVWRAFCPTCGAGVYARVSAMPGMIFLRASTLDNPNLFAPQLAVYASRAPAWDPVTPGIPAFAERPPPIG